MVKRVASREPVGDAGSEGSSSSSSPVMVLGQKKRLLLSSTSLSSEKKSHNDAKQQQLQPTATATTIMGASVCETDDAADEEELQSPSLLLETTVEGLGGSKIQGETAVMELQSASSSSSSSSKNCASLRPSPVTVATSTSTSMSTCTTTTDAAITTTTTSTTASVTQTDEETTTSLTTQQQSKEDNTRITTTATTAAATTTTNNDVRCGLVVEAASRHADRRLHPERPARIQAIVEALERRQLWQRCVVLLEEESSDDGDSGDDNKKGSSTSSSIDSAAAAFLNDDDYLRVHLPGYLKRLDKLSSAGCCCRASCAGCDSNNNNSSRVNNGAGNCKQLQQQQLQERCSAEAAQYDSVFLTPQSLAEAKRAAAALCRLTARAVAGRLDAGFAVIRPPGHHARPGLAGGYCLLNNVALAAAYARSQCSSPMAAAAVNKILIVDYDVHLGHGTQSIFLDDPNVLYFSVHRYGGTFYPFTANATTAADGGGCDTVGRGAGCGATVNVGWSCAGMGDAEYVAVWQRLLLPIAREFDPDLVLVSAGFDAAAGDLGECRVTPRGFAELTRLLRQCLHRICVTDDGDSRSRSSSHRRARPAPVVCALEGGYVRSTLGECVAAVVEQLLVDPSSNNNDDDDDSTASVINLNDIHPSAARNIQQTMDAQRPYWSCLRDAATVEKQSTYS